MEVDCETYPSFELLNSNLVSLQDIVARHGLSIVNPPRAKLSSLVVVRQTWGNAISSIQVWTSNSGLDEMRAAKDQCQESGVNHLVDGNGRAEKGWSQV